MQKNTGWDIEGRILRDKEHVSVVDNDHLMISDSARVAMRCEQLTDGVFDTELQMENAQRTLLQFRTSPYADSVQHNAGFTISITETETVVSNADTSIVTPLLLTPSTPFRLTVRQHGNFFDVEIACKNCGRIQTAAPSSQWLIASLPNGGTMHFIDPQFRPLISDK